ncbi:hypothetical protein Tco_0787538 [Tanacetum coccineum]
MMEKLFRMELELMLSTVKVKTLNGEVQLHALVDGKKIIITEVSVRRDLQLADENGIDCLPNSTIFEQLALMGPKTTAWNEFSNKAVHKELGDNLVRAASIASSLEAEQDNGNINKTQSKETPNESSSLRTTLGGGPRNYPKQEVAANKENDEVNVVEEVVQVSAVGNVVSTVLKEFDSIQEMFDRAFKRQKVNDDKETTKLKQLMEITPDEEEGDLKTMFEPNVEDKIWRNQQDYKVLDWKMYDSCGVHSLRMQHMQIHMLVEKKYPLAPLTLSKMLEKMLIIDYESEMAYQLLKFIMKQFKK